MYFVVLCDSVQGCGLRFLPLFRRFEAFSCFRWIVVRVGLKKWLKSAFLCVFRKFKLKNLYVLCHKEYFKYLCTRKKHIIHENRRVL